MPRWGSRLIIIYIVMIAPVVKAQVSSVFPLSQTVDADPFTEISISFATPLNPASFVEEDLFVFGRWSGVATGTILFEDGNTKLQFVLDKPFMAGEWVTVSLANRVQDVNGAQLGKGYTWNFWTRAKEGTFDFQMIDDISSRNTGERLIRSYGAYAGDLNRDGYSDLMIPNEVANDIRIFYNNGTGGYKDFTIYPIPDGSVPSTNEGSDFNRDGMIDFAVGNTGNDKVSVWMGEENGGVFHKANATADQNIRGLCVMDLDGDAVMDIVTANRTGLQDTGNISLLINDGAGNFSSPLNIETNSAGETACASIDANGDGILDVFIGAYDSNEVLLYLGNGEGGLVFSEKQRVGAGPWMLAAGDLNGDGFADVVSSNTGAGTVSVVLGNGDGTLRLAKNYETGLFPLAIDLGDLDGDGDLDVVTSNFSSNDYTILENEADGSLSKRLTLPATSAASCTILHDRDNDGDLDITGIDELADRIFLFDNVTEATSIEGVIENPSQPSQFELLGNYPNPFSHETSIQIYATDAGFVEVAIYNLMGKKVRTIKKGVISDGLTQITWDSTSDAGEKLGNGFYYYSVSSKYGTKTRPLLLIR